MDEDSESGDSADDSEDLTAAATVDDHPSRASSASVASSVTAATVKPRSSWCAPAREAVRESRRLHRERTSSLGSALLSASKRRRGVRKWTVGASVPPSPATAAAADAAVPTVVVQLFDWLIRALQLLDQIDPGVADEDGGRWWAAALLRADDDGGDARTGERERTLLESILSPGEASAVNPSAATAFGVVRTLLVDRTVAVLHSLPALSARNETIAWLYTAAVWHLEGARMARAYIRYWFLPQLMATPLGHGLPRVTGVTLHRDRGTGEWYLSTTGSNFQGLHGATATVDGGLCIDRTRCITTNIPELLACLGLEAVCWFFSNGDLAPRGGSGGGRGQEFAAHTPLPRLRVLWASTTRPLAHTDSVVFVCV